jgi:hypothetical protein
VGNAQYFLNVFTQSAQDGYFQEWCANKGASSKLVLYNECKSLLQPEKYLSCISNKWHLYSLCSLRISAHKLEIELGRHNNVERQFRLCRLCIKQNIYVVEDEFHF